MVAENKVGMDELPRLAALCLVSRPLDNRDKHRHITALRPDFAVTSGPTRLNEPRSHRLYILLPGNRVNSTQATLPASYAVRRRRSYASQPYDMNMTTFTTLTAELSGAIAATSFKVHAF